MLSKLYEEFKKLNMQITQLKNEPKALMDISPEKIYRWPKVYETMLRTIRHQGSAN